VLAFIAWRAGRQKYSAYYHNPVLISGLYWHFVDVIWVWLYSLFYLVNRY